MKFTKKEKKKISIIAWFGAWLLRFWFSTVRVKIVNKKEYNEYFKPLKDNVVVGFWHRNLMFFLYFFSKIENKLGMASKSRDGEIGTSVAKRFGYTTIRGSSSRGGGEALQAIIDIMKSKDKNYFCGTPVDGPRGPVRKLKKGMPALAKEAGAYFVPITFSGTKVITFSKAWDKTIMPFPFSKVVVIFDEPFKISKDLSDEEFKKVCYDIEMNLNNITDKADMMCGYK
jgi:lysophospholipid acyltransferase (LPLAT)-like uncharacterized protein